jgi:hypothetical protein
MLPCPSTSKYRWLTPSIIATSFLTSCATILPQQDITAGTIAFPFVAQTEAIGLDSPGDKFVIKSTIGGAQYTVEIPDAARDYDIVVPLADIRSLDSQTGAASAAATDPDAGPSSTTDRELVAEFPRIEGRSPDDLALVDSAFGVTNADGTTQGPSYTVKLAKIVDMYKARNYEFALIEINNLLAYYPNSPRLYKMKGTILIKLRSLDLALGAWVRASELEPLDGRIKRAIMNLERKISANKRTTATQQAVPETPAGARPQLQ